VNGHTFSGRGAAAAIAFLTRLPVPRRWYEGPHPWRWALAWFPVVGALVGSILGATWSALAALDGLVAAFVVVLVGIFVTGALHEDGLADTADAIGSGATGDRLFEILKDSRVGTYGALALICSVGLRVSALAGQGSAAPESLVIAHTLGRAVPVFIMSRTSYVTPSAEAHSSVFSRAAHPAAVVAWLTAAAIVLPVSAMDGRSLAEGAGFVAVGLAIAAAAAWYFRTRVGGHTGDLLGAAQQVTECAMLVICGATL
jgi:adenosylcobinamide-GDP ribazoletransferase